MYRIYTREFQRYRSMMMMYSITRPKTQSFTLKTNIPPLQYRSLIVHKTTTIEPMLYHSKNFSTFSTIRKEDKNKEEENEEDLLGTFSGRVTLPDGREYSGEFEKGIPNGRGTTWSYSINKDGKKCLLSKYEGEHSNGIIEGFGSLYNGSNQLVYEGEWKSGKIEGKGKLIVRFSDTKRKSVDIPPEEEEEEEIKVGLDASEDELLTELQHLESTLCSDEEKICSVIEGEFKENQVSGKASLYHKESFEDEESILIYEGEWKEGKEHGKGTRIYSDGSVYSGEWRNGTQYGKGELISGLDKSIYSGDFVNGNWEGYGYLKDPNGRLIYQGDWKAGTMDGKGCLYVYSEDELFMKPIKIVEGEFVEGLIHGKATLMDNKTNKVLYDGNWVKGKRAEEKK